jgi:hypothetical protein
LFGRILEGSLPWLDLLGSLVVRIWSAFSFEGSVELVRNRIEIVRKEPGVNVERRGTEAWSSICCTALTLAPAATARLAAV